MFAFHNRLVAATGMSTQPLSPNFCGMLLNPNVAAELDGTEVILSDHRNVYLNITHRIGEEWHKKEPNADLLAARIEADLLQQIRERYPIMQ